MGGRGKRTCRLAEAVTQLFELERDIFLFHRDIVPGIGLGSWSGGWPAIVQTDAIRGSGFVGNRSHGNQISAGTGEENLLPSERGVDTDPMLGAPDCQLKTPPSRYQREKGCTL